MGRKEVREFEKSKVVPYREVLPYSVAKVEFGEKGNFVRIIIRGFSRQSNGDLCNSIFMAYYSNAKSKRCIQLVEVWMKK